jgi:hypothetical protein
VKHRYYVITFDPELDRYTPQVGVRCGPYTLFGLRKALRKLESMGYDIRRDYASAILVEREDERRLRLEFEREEAGGAK